MNKPQTGVELSRQFYIDCANPILSKRFDFFSKQHSAALFGHGSESLGFDDQMSQDHDFGPRVMIFISQNHLKYKEEMWKILSEELPLTYKGYPTNFAPTGEGNVHVLSDVPKEQKFVNHGVKIDTVENYFQSYIGIDVHKEISIADWLATPQQKLLAVTSGKVFYDGLGTLTQIRNKLSYYPRGVWLYLLVAQYLKISNETAFVGRAGYVGDELGSSVVASIIVKDIMLLSFLIERKYAPYSKWLGSAFSKLTCSKQLTPVLQKVMYSTSWKEREKHLCKAYEIIGEMHNTLKLGEYLDPKPVQFHSRPFMVFNAEQYIQQVEKVLKQDMQWKNIQKIVESNQGLFTGGVDQLMLGAQNLSNAFIYTKLKTTYYCET